MVTLLKINGELAEIIRLSETRSKIVYLTAEPEHGLPTELHHERSSLRDRFWRERLVLQEPDVLAIKRVKPKLLYGRDARQRMRQLLTKFRFDRTHP